jgi:hypothetical protein
MSIMASFYIWVQQLYSVNKQIDISYKIILIIHILVLYLIWSLVPDEILQSYGLYFYSK